MKINILDTNMLDIPKSVLFTDKALNKMRALVKGYDKEIAWHGVMTKEDDRLVISDILVYPQMTTATTVDADEEDYPMWVAQLPDEQFEHLRMQGHSHVDMACVPSATDEKYYKELVGQFDDHYLVLIANKKGDMYVRYYDIKNNIVVENIPITSPGMYKDWAEDQIKKYVKDEPITLGRMMPYNFKRKTKNSLKRLYWDSKNKRLSTYPKGTLVAEIRGNFMRQKGAQYYEIHDGPFGVSEYLTIYNKTYTPDVWYYIISEYDENANMETFSDLMISHNEFKDGIIYNKYMQVVFDINDLAGATPAPEELLIKKEGK